MTMTHVTDLKLRRTAPGRIQAIVVCIISFLLVNAVHGADREVRVGVLTRGSVEEAIQMWPPTMRYLTESIPGHIFQLRPLGFEHLGSAVARGELDFVITNSGHYVQLEMQYGASRIATLKKHYADNVYTTQFGGVILVRADRNDLRQFDDLRNKHFMAVNERSFGGWTMALRELKAEGIDQDDLASLRFAGNHRDVVRAVLEGTVDAGTVRTETIEQMALGGEIDSAAIRILRPAHLEVSPRDAQFPFAYSTRLYPEWPFARLPSTDDRLAEQVAVALLQMPPESDAAKSARIVGWTVPLNYQPVHELMRELRLGPYAELEALTLAGAMRRHWQWVAITLGALLVLSATTLYVTRLNRRILNAKLALEREGRERNRAERVLRQSEERFRNLVETTHDFVWETDQFGNYTYASPQVRQLLGIDPADLVGRPLDSIREIRPETAGGLNFTLFYRQQPFVSVETTCRHRNGHLVVLECSGVPCFDNHGAFQGFRGINRDITERQQSAEALHREKERAQVTLDAIVDGVIRTDANGTVEYLNKAAAQLCGWHADEVIGRPVAQILTLVDEAAGVRVPSPVETLLNEGTPKGGAPAITSALLLRPGLQHDLHLELRAAPLRDQQQRIVGAVVVFHDVSEVRRLTRQLAHQASHDSLTELLNRGEFERRLSECLVEARAGSHHHVLCYLDLDQFKVVNDTSGHAAGDELLRVLAQRLQLAIRDGDVLARLGGDEFGILLRNCSTEHAINIAQELCRVVGEVRLEWDGRVFRVGVSAGLVPLGRDAGSLTDVLSAADAACYVAKERGRNRVHLFEPDDTALAQHHGQMQWVYRIKDALEEGRFRLYCEEFVPLTTAAGALQPFEILLRMVEKDGREITPMQFIPAAERYHLMPAVDRWVLARTFDLLGQVAQNGEYPLRLFTINLSGQSLSDDTFLDYVVELLERSKLSPATICFEITETAAIAHLHRAMRLMTTLKEKGCRFALDDFGTGVSSFGYLRTLPVDFLKIDGSFLKNSLSDPIDYAMVDAINQVGQLMELRTVAEGVEQAVTLDRVKKLGVDYAQGHSLSMTLPLERVLGLVEPAPAKKVAGDG